MIIIITLHISVTYNFSYYYIIYTFVEFYGDRRSRKTSLAPVPTRCSVPSPCSRSLSLPLPTLLPSRPALPQPATSSSGLMGRHSCPSLPLLPPGLMGRHSCPLLLILMLCPT